MKNSPEPISDTAGREIVQTRLFDAPRDLVWQMFTDPKHIIHWWGPNGFTNTIHEMDVKPGGIWRFIMHGPDGTDYQNKNIFTRVEKPHILAFEHVSGPHFFCTITLDDEGSKTRLNFRMVFTTAEERDRTVRQFGAVEGLTQTLARLADKLKLEQDPSPPFILSRTFDAPRDLVWKAWTEREQLMHWFGPKGFVMEFAKLDFRPGGMFLYKLKSPDGQQIWGKFSYREIHAPDRLVWVNSFSDENGNVTRHYLRETWPLELLTTVTFEENAGKTTVTVHWRPMSPTEIERQTFDSNHDSMRMGWGGTFDQLQEYL